MPANSDNKFLRGGYAIVRSVVLAVSTLAIIGVLFAVYQYSTGPDELAATGDEALRVDPVVSVPSDAGSSPRTIGDQPLGEGGEFRIIDYEPGTNRARMELESTGWRPVGDAEGDTQQIEVDKPEIRLLTPDGQRIRIRADSGVIEIVKTGKRTEPRRGRLNGDVRVDVDRLSEAERDALPANVDYDANDESRMVRLTFDSVSFDKSEGRLDTDGPFTLRMREAEVDGRGLHLAYNQFDNRVEHFEIAQGGSIRVRGMQSLIGGQGKEETREQEIEGPRKPGDKGVDQRLDTYVAEIEDAVAVRRFEGVQNVQRLAADSVRVLFDFSREQREAARAGRSSAPRENDATGDAEVRDDHVTLEWSGRLVIRPEHEDRSQDSTTPRLRMLATGKEVRLVDRLGEVTCRKLEVHRDTGGVWVSGSGDDRVVFTLKDRGTLVGGDMFIDGDGQTARIDGPARWVGTLETPGGNEGDSDAVDLRFEEVAEFVLGKSVRPSTDAVSGAVSASTKDYVRSARFTGDVVFRRGDELLAGDVLALEFAEPTAADAAAMNLRTLDAQGSVLLVRKGDGANDRITCARLHLEFVPGPDGRPSPRTADVRGDVVISRGDLLVTATDYVMLEMAPVAKRSATVDTPIGADRADESEYTVGLEWLAAVGNVTASDPTRNLELSAESLVAELVNGGDISVARVTGPDNGPAFVALDGRSITAHRIDADVLAESADVFGAGEIRLLTRRGLDGARLDTALPIEVSWTKTMSFSGRRNTARFLGDVHAVSRQRLTNTALPQHETVAFDCEELVMDFVDVAPDMAEDEDADASKLGREPVYVVASRDVVCVFTTVDSLTGKVTKRNRFAADKLTVDLRADLLNVPGGGSLLIEDYERRAAATSDEPKRESLFTSAADGLPSQTYISWSGSLSYHQARNRADFRDDVHLDHRRGDEMALAGEQLASTRSPSGGDKSKGRRTRLDCGALVVEFADSDPSAPASVGGMSITDIRQLEATGGVRLADNDFTVDAYRVVKYDNSDLLRVYGTPDRDAEIYGLDSGTGQLRALEFNYDLKTGRVDAVTLQIRDRR